MEKDLESPSAEGAPRVFLSYSHDSRDHAERVRALADRLRSDGIDAWIDQYEPVPPEGWPLWMERQVERADFVLSICTETYRRRFDQKEAPGSGLGVTWEGALLRLQLYLDQGENGKILPVIFSPEDKASIPAPLQPFSYFQPTTAEGYLSLYRHLTGEPEVEPPELGKQRKLPLKPRRSHFGEPIEMGSGLAEYAAWAKRRYAHLELIGIDAGDVRIDLEEVYVPLRMVWHEAFEGAGMGLFRGTRLHGESGERQEVEIEEVLTESTLAGIASVDSPRHSLIFGEPGSGKTTALTKLHQLCWQPGPAALGLAEGTMPVFLRLRQLSRELLDAGLAAFLEHEIAELSGGRLEGLGEALWAHGRLLLLLDGLDEIAEEGYRAEVLQRIGWYLGQDDAAGVRAVVSCRRLGLPPRQADRDRLFRTFEVRPFQDEQITQLVKLWFRELARRGRITPATADQRVAKILDALGGPKVANQQILQMASNPLLLTLLCVVVLLGDEIPRKRVRFYEQCLDVLLDRWPRQRGKEAPVDLGIVRDALGRLAFHLHSARRKGDLGWAETVAQLKRVLGNRQLALELFRWLHGDVGLLVDYTEEDYGFVHLGVQEHLAARHLIDHPEDLEGVGGDLEGSWWVEVFLQVSALSERTGFDALMAHLLERTDALERRASLLRDCLRETSRPELAAFLRVLAEGGPKRQQAVLRLLHGIVHRPPELLEAAERLAAAAAPEIRKLAEQLVQSDGKTAAAERLGLLYGDSEDQKLAEALAARLRGWRGGLPAAVVQGTGRQSGERLDSCGMVVVLLGSVPETWAEVGPLRELYDDKPWLAVRLPGEPRPAVPEVFADCEALEWRRGEEEALIEAIAERLPSCEPERVPEPPSSLGILPEGTRVAPAPDAESPYTESVLGIEFLPVPGGSFVMGSDDLWTPEDRKRIRKDLLKAPTPASRVRLSPFLLARTAVTNAQYGRFLEATGYREPATWRDRRFSAPEQPVVSVSWEDAVAFCTWLSGESGEGLEFQLPSEAQWEYAARGRRSRVYPWGNTPEPNEMLACFGLDPNEAGPASVGSYPEGAGPFGHLDLAGGVWEWCLDAWEPDLSRWAKRKPLDPVGESDPSLRPLRGGGWLSGAPVLRSAFRSRIEPGDRDGDVGFRVLSSPSSSDL